MRTAIPFFCADFVNQYDKRESVIALPFPILASTFRLVGNDEVGLRALSVRRGAQGDTAAGIGQLQQTIVRALTAGQRHRIQARIRVGGVPGVGLFPIEQAIQPHFPGIVQGNVKILPENVIHGRPGARKMP